MSEFWLSGPVEGVHPLLVPAAHTFLQVRHDVRDLLAALSIEQLWMKLNRSAPIGFHAVHIAGSTHRLLTYARGESLSDAQLEQVRRGEQSMDELDSADLISRVDRAMDAAIAQLRAMSETTLLEPRIRRQKTIAVDDARAGHACRRARVPACWTNRDPSTDRCRRGVKSPLDAVVVSQGDRGDQ